VKVKTEGNVINLMDALRQSLKGQASPAVRETVAKEAATKEPVAKKSAKSKKATPGQREMLLPIQGKGQKTAAKAETKRETAKRPAQATTRQKRAG
jgi:DNA end-binding protein Ku